MNTLHKQFAFACLVLLATLSSVSRADIDLTYAATGFSLGVDTYETVKEKLAAQGAHIEKDHIKAGEHYTEHDVVAIREIQATQIQSLNDAHRDDVKTRAIFSFTNEGKLWKVDAFWEDTSGFIPAMESFYSGHPRAKLDLNGKYSVANSIDGTRITVRKTPFDKYPPVKYSLVTFQDKAMTKEVAESQALVGEFIRQHRASQQNLLSQN